jgi:hypothetical protein
MTTRIDKDSDPLARHSLSPGELKELLAIERSGKAFLALKDEQGSLVLFDPGRGGRTRTIGRRADMDLAIPWDAEVSGLHAELQGLGGEWTIVDDGLSTNGTFVNGERVNGRRRLRSGDRICVGRTVLAYAGPSEGVAESTVTAGDSPAAQKLTDTQRQVLVALCRPYRGGGGFVTPASNQRIAEELFLSVDAVKMHLRTLFGKFELAELPQNQKRARLAECVLRYGIISQRDLA